MDLGLVTTLGAIGAGGVALLAKILHRRRSGLQQGPEQEVLVDYPDHDDLISYAQNYRGCLTNLRKAYIEITLVDDETGEEISELLANARRLWDESSEGLKKSDSAMLLQRPETVREMATEASSKLSDYSIAIHRAIDSIAIRETSRENHMQAAKEMYILAYRAYLDFLYVAAEIYGDDEILRLQI
ncbi:hypothetical protein H7827_03870 [Streptomyces sp. JH002]|uniref:hypothetical protein n=1 Tax=Streptomyces sp. JH002 TaxID=2763259 RepID=UPI003D805D07